MLCILLRLHRDIEVNRRRVPTCSPPLLTTVCDTPPPALSTANHLALSATSPGIPNRIQDLTESPTANLFNSFCPTLVPTSRLYFTFIVQLSVVTPQSCAPLDSNKYHNLAIPFYLSRPQDSLVQLINLNSLFV